MEREITRDNYAHRPEFMTDLSNREMQQQAQVICDLADRLLDEKDIVVGDTLKMGAPHLDDGTHVIKRRHFSIDDEGLIILTDILYEQNCRYNTELYDITRSVAAELDSGFAHLPAVTYQLHRAGDIVSHANQVAYDVSQGGLVPASLDDLRVIQDGFFAIIHTSDQGQGRL